jgi:putative tricarboxylic transport membrane protein
MWTLNVPFAYEPVGPKAFPVLLAVLMIWCCVVLIASPDLDIHWPELPMLGRGVALVTALVAYASLFEFLGFPLATIAMVLVVSRIFGGGLISGAVTGVLIGVLGFLFFDQFLKVSLPLGRIWG